MTDRELLEFAAKAAGIDFNTRSGSELRVAHGDVFRVWNPLDSDGDALRLAVRLGIDIYLDPNAEDEPMAQAVYPGVLGDPAITEPYGNDGCAATRRAVVRAAAVLGKEMK